MKILLLLILSLSLFGLDADKELIEEKAKITDPVCIIFDLTVVNKDKGTTETVRIQNPYILKEWEKTYRPLTLLEFKTYGQLGYIRALPVIIIIQTL